MSVRVHRQGVSIYVIGTDDVPTACRAAGISPETHRWARGNPYSVEQVGKTTWHVMRASWVCATYHSRSAADARGDAVRRLQALLKRNFDPWGAERIRTELAGHDLMCWCPLDQPCHADVLLELANARGAAC